jgi:hypothetical protein
MKTTHSFFSVVNHSIMKRSPQLIAALLLCVCSMVAEGRIPFEESLKAANVTLTKMENGYHESLILGNGDLYGIVWEKDGGLFMRITKNDIWDARVDTSEDGDLPHRLTPSQVRF